jgi:hypothetical protein
MSHAWQLLEVKNLAIRELEKQSLPVIDRIILYQRCEVDLPFLVPLYAVLCSQDEPPSDEQSERLGLEATALIFRARESLRKRPSAGERPPPHTKDDASHVIQDMLGNSLPSSLAIGGRPPGELIPCLMDHPCSSSTATLAHLNKFVDSTHGESRIPAIRPNVKLRKGVIPKTEFQSLMYSNSVVPRVPLDVGSESTSSPAQQPP